MPICFQKNLEVPIFQIVVLTFYLRHEAEYYDNVYFIQMPQTERNV